MKHWMKHWVALFLLMCLLPPLPAFAVENRDYSGDWGEYLVSMGALYAVLNRGDLEGHNHMGDLFPEDGEAGRERVRSYLKDSWSISEYYTALGNIEAALVFGYRNTFQQVYNAIRTGTQEQWANGEEDRIAAYQRAMGQLEVALPEMELRFGYTQEQINAVHSIAAVDYARTAFCIRNCYALGYIPEEEAWDLLERVAEKARAEFDSWDEYFISIILGLSMVTEDNLLVFIDAGEQLLTHAQSTWLLCPFDMEPPAPIMPEEDEYSGDWGNYLVSLGAPYHVEGFLPFEGHDQLDERWVANHGEAWVQEVRLATAVAWGITDHDTALSAMEQTLETGHREKYQQVYDAIRTNTQEEWAHGMADRIGAYQRAMERLEEDWSSLRYIGGFSYDQIEAVESIAAWDYVRVAHITKECYNLGYLSREEAFGLLERVAQKAQAEFDSWDEYFISFILGRLVVWNDEKTFSFISGGKRLFNREESAWIRYPFDMQPK